MPRQRRLSNVSKQSAVPLAMEWFNTKRIQGSLDDLDSREFEKGETFSNLFSFVLLTDQVFVLLSSTRTVAGGEGFLHANDLPSHTMPLCMISEKKTRIIVLSRTSHNAYKAQIPIFHTDLHVRSNQLQDALSLIAPCR
ncbi:hypothetical protein EV213_10984 [Aureibacillus halotolerans]|uniref:Uncharacterized protein n=1 Tax=Aureibacillus halotolerans TaxID=1508390 RepID=A0A4R6U2U9_9BACI|nr:hypothetical protein EV213_10984 [Aureibacillus halotolerans]